MSAAAIEGILRVARREDVPAIQRVRHAVLENRLVSRVIGDDEVIDYLERLGRGWVVTVNGEVVAFAIGDASNGNIWALFVDPAYEARGFGRRLHDRMVAWLFAQGIDALWLTTEPGTRAERFYRRAGWRDRGLVASGERRFEMRNEALTMDTRTIAALLLKITGLVLIVVCVSLLPGYFPLRSRDHGVSIGEILASAAIALGPLAVMGLGLWFFPGKVANKVVSNSPASQPVFDSHGLQLIALTIVGVYLVTDGLIDAARDVVLVIFLHRQNESLSAAPASVIAYIAATVAKLGVGAYLCIGAKGVSRVIERLRG